MSGLTSRASLYKPASGETVNVTTDINNNLDAIDLNMNFRSCTSSTRPSTKWDGLCIHETDTNRQYIWNSSPATSGWFEIYGGGGSISQINLSAATTATMSVTSNVSGDSNKRLQVRGDGRLEWGSGSGATDSFLRRTGVNALTTDGDLTIASTATIQSSTDSTALNVTGGGTFAKSLTVGGTASLAGGVGVLGLKNAATAPTAVPSNGIVLYSENGLLKTSNVSGASSIVNGAYRLSATNTVASSTTETDICVLTIPANDAVTGATYRITAWGTCSHTTGSPTIQWQALLGANSLSGTSALTCNSTAATLRPWRAQADLVCLGTGASGPWFGTLAVTHTSNTTTAASATDPQHRILGTATVANATTSSNDFKLTFKWSANSASNTMTCRGYSAERIA